MADPRLYEMQFPTAFPRQAITDLVDHFRNGTAMDVYTQMLAGSNIFGYGLGMIPHDVTPPTMQAAATQTVSACPDSELADKCDQLLHAHDNMTAQGQAGVAALPAPVVDLFKDLLTQLAVRMIDWLTKM